MKKFILLISIIGVLFLFGCEKNSDSDKTTTYNDTKEFSLMGDIYPDPKYGELSIYIRDLSLLDLSKTPIDKNNIQEILDAKNHGQAYLTLKKGENGIFEHSNLTLNKPDNLEKDEVALPVNLTEVADENNQILNNLQIDTADEKIKLIDGNIDSIKIIGLLTKSLPIPKVDDEKAKDCVKLNFTYKNDKIKFKSKEVVDCK